MFCRRGLISDNDEAESTLTADKNAKSIENKANTKNLTNSSNASTGTTARKTSKKFFQNIFEFHREKDDTYEYCDYEFFNNNLTTKFKGNVHAINSIIEEEEEPEMDINVNSYPKINQKHLKRNVHKPKAYSLVRQHSQHEMVSNVPVKLCNEKNELNKSQEICFQELPMRFHSKYIQPIKHSYSDQYPCYTGPMSESFTNTLTNKSKSFSHSQLRNAHNTAKLFTNTKRQYSIEELDGRSNPETQFIPDYNRKYIPKSGYDNWNNNNNIRPRISNSALSYHLMHPSKRREIYAASKTNSDASIGSSNRYTSISNPNSYRI